MFRPLTERRIILTGIATTVFVLLASLVAIRGYAVYRISRDLASLKDDFHAHEVVRKSHDDALRAELDEIQRTLYSMPATPPPPVRRESAVEQWMLNRDKEIQTRLRALEQWRYRAEQ